MKRSYDVVDIVSELVDQLKLCALFGMTLQRAARAIKQGEEYLAGAKRVSEGTARPQIMTDK